MKHCCDTGNNRLVAARSIGIAEVPFIGEDHTFQTNGIGGHIPGAAVGAVESLFCVNIKLLRLLPSCCEWGP